MAETKEVALLAPSQGGIVVPQVSVREAAAAFKQYEDLKAALVDPKKDIQMIQKRPFLKKSYWRKIATCFNLSVEVVEERKEVLKDSEDKPVDALYHFVCKATAPNGRYATGTGSCGVVSKSGDHHNARATAETRAYNRAVSNLVGGGEVSAEEVDRNIALDDEDEHTNGEENGND